MRLSASSEVPKVLVVTSQPVSSSKGVTQSTAGSFDAVLDVAGPREERDLALHLAELGGGLAAVRAAALGWCRTP